MERDDKAVYIILVIFALLVLVGFYFIFDKMSSLKSDINSLELSVKLLSKEKNQSSETSPITAPPVQNLPQNPTSTNPPETSPESQTISIPTAIIFTADSSPTLQPQTKLTIVIDNVEKTKDGTVAVNLKIYSNETTSYSALDPKGLFTIINLTGENRSALFTQGQFNSIPPKSITGGNVIFKIEPTQNSIILQVGAGENAKYYEFNFQTKTYKEAVIG